MPPLKRSGHARLKAALVLRDALAAELGLPLPAAIAQLRTVENNIDAARGLTEGKYLEALGPVCAGDAAHLSTLDTEGRYGAWASKARRLQLVMDPGTDGMWGFGATKRSDIRDHPAPCEALWQQTRKGK